ncbi:unnamed protein product, partial [Polarella glacialis]
AFLEALRRPNIQRTMTNLQTRGGPHLDKGLRLLVTQEWNPIMKSYDFPVSEAGYQFMRAQIAMFEENEYVRSAAHEIERLCGAVLGEYFGIKLVALEPTEVATSAHLHSRQQLEGWTIVRMQLPAAGAPTAVEASLPSVRAVAPAAATETTTTAAATTATATAAPAIATATTTSPAYFAPTWPPEFPQASGFKTEDEGGDVSCFEVVHDKLALRGQPALSADVVGIARAGQRLLGRTRLIGGGECQEEEWLCLDSQSCRKLGTLSAESWALVRPAVSLGLGQQQQEETTTDDNNNSINNDNNSHNNDNNNSHNCHNNNSHNSHNSHNNSHTNDNNNSHHSHSHNNNNTDNNNNNNNNYNYYNNNNNNNNQQHSNLGEPLRPAGRQAEPPKQLGNGGRYAVACARVAVRAAPKLGARVVGVMLQGRILLGTPHESEGLPWLRLEENARKKIAGSGHEAWVLIHGEVLGLGQLLRPLDSTQTLFAQGPGLQPQQPQETQQVLHTPLEYVVVGVDQPAPVRLVQAAELGRLPRGQRAWGFPGGGWLRLAPCWAELSVSTRFAEALEVTWPGLQASGSQVAYSVEWKLAATAVEAQAAPSAAAEAAPRAAVAMAHNGQNPGSQVASRPSTSVGGHQVTRGTRVVVNRLPPGSTLRLRVAARIFAQEGSGTEDVSLLGSWAKASTAQPIAEELDESQALHLDPFGQERGGCAASGCGSFATAASEEDKGGFVSAAVLPALVRCARCGIGYAEHWRGLEPTSELSRFELAAYEVVHSAVFIRGSRHVKGTQLGVLRRGVVVHGRREGSWLRLGPDSLEAAAQLAPGAGEANNNKNNKNNKNNSSSNNNNNKNNSNNNNNNNNNSSNNNDSSSSNSLAGWVLVDGARVGLGQLLQAV